MCASSQTVGHAVYMVVVGHAVYAGPELPRGFPGDPISSPAQPARPDVYPLGVGIV